MVYICDECIDLCNEDHRGGTSPSQRRRQTGDVACRAEIRTFLANEVIGQDRAKQTLAVAV